MLPAYNEEQNVGIVVDRALEILPRLVDEFEIIVVDDGSRDRTADLVTELVAEHHPRVRLIRHAANKGYGAAIRSGFRASRHELLFYTDADNQFDVSELEWFLPLTQEYDVIVGFRVYRYDDALRSILSWIYNRLVSVLFRVRVRDVDCAFKLLRREVWDKIDVESSDFFVDAEIVAKARKWNFRITEKGVRHYPRLAGETTVRPSDIPNTLRTIARMWRMIYFPNRAMLEAARELHAALDRTAVEVVPPGVRGASGSPRPPGG